MAAAFAADSALGRFAPDAVADSVRPVPVKGSAYVDVAGLENGSDILDDGSGKDDDVVDPT